MHFKYCFLLLLSFGFLVSHPPTLKAQTATKAFYKAHKRKPGVFNVRIPSFLIWFGSGLAYNSVNDPEAKAAIKLAKKVKGLWVLTVESENVIAKEDINSFLQEIREGPFEDLIFVKEAGTSVQILGRASAKSLKELSILVEDSGSFTYVTAKTNLKSKDVSQLINSIVNKDKVQEDKRADKRADRRAERKERKAAKKVEKLPQA